MEDDGSATRRDRSIRLAVLTSILSKGGTALLQLLAIPLAVRVMGREEFGLYTSVGLTLSTIVLLEVGVGPALAHGLSEARAKGDGEKARRLVSTALVLIVGLALIAGIMLASVLALVPIPTLFGPEYAGMESLMRPALWMGLVLFLLIFILNLTDRLREGLLEVARTNAWGAAGNVLAAVSVSIGVWFVPEVWFLVLAIHGSVVLAKLGNTVMLWRKHPDLLPSLRGFDRGTARHLFTDGAAFATCCLLVGVVEYNFCTWMVGQLHGPSQVALYGIFVTLSVMQLGFVIMLSTPTWPAVAEALARGDLEWARKAGKKLYLYGLAFATCSFIGMVSLGPWALEVWLGEKFAGIPRGLLAAYSFYFVAHVWRHMNHALMIGTGQVMALARVQFLETGVLALAAWFALKYGCMGYMLVAMAVVIFSATGWVLPLKVRQRLQPNQESDA
ncbi:MAG: lipopolysaccharide biosynthesis protein [Haloferula sp.]